MSILSEYMSKIPSTNPMVNLRGILSHECKPAKDTSLDVCNQLKIEQTKIDNDFSVVNPCAISGDLLEKYRVKKMGAEKLRHTMDIYIFPNQFADPVYLAECKYRMTLPTKVSTLQCKEENLLIDVVKKYRLSKKYLSLQGRVVRAVPAFLVCSEPLAAPLYSDYIDYCDGNGVSPIFRIVDTDGLKSELKRIGIC